MKGLSRDAVLTLMRDSLGIDTNDIDDDTVLFSSGLLDSFSLVQLITAIEAATSAKVSPLDVNLENFDSLERIMNLVERLAPA